MTLRIVTHPAAEPITLAEAKLHLRVDHADEDLRIAAFIAAARQQAEHITQRHLMPTQLEQVLDAWPCGGHIALGTAPVQSIAGVTYLDADGIEQTIDSAAYQLDDAKEPAWLLQAAGTSWPAAAASANAVRVRFWAGYAPTILTVDAQRAAVPEGLKAWMYLVIGTLYKQAETFINGNAVEVPATFVDRLLDPYRLWSNL